MTRAINGDERGKERATAFSAVRAEMATLLAAFEAEVEVAVACQPWQGTDDGDDRLVPAAPAPGTGLPDPDTSEKERKKQ